MVARLYQPGVAINILFYFKDILLFLKNNKNKIKHSYFYLKVHIFFYRM